MSGGIAYFVILSLFPLLIVAVSVASLFFEPEYVTEELTVFLGRYVPVSVEYIERNVSNVVQLRGAVGAVSFVMLVWSGSALFASLSRVVNRVWGIGLRRPFYIEKLRHIAMVFVSGALFAASIMTTVLFQVATSFEVEALGGTEIWRRGFVQAGSYGVSFSFTAVTFLLIYRYIPNATVSWRQVWPGTLFAAALFEATKLIFVFYMRNFSNPELVYGSLGSAVALLLWCYISAHIFVIGAALSAELGVGGRRIDGQPLRPDPT